MLAYHNLSQNLSSTITVIVTVQDYIWGNTSAKSMQFVMPIWNKHNNWLHEIYKVEAAISGGG
jgi:hypothetical protein